jgi:hypothetical protein
MKKNGTVCVIIHHQGMWKEKNKEAHRKSRNK